MTPNMKFLRHLSNTITDQEKGSPRLFLTSTIYYNLKRGLTYHESHFKKKKKNLCEAFGSIAPGKSTVRKWFTSHFNDDNRCGRSVSAATQENAARVKELIRKDARITCKDLQDILGIGMSALNEILHHQLGVHKRCARWVPHQLTEEQKVGMAQWCLTMLEKYDSGRANSTWNIVNSDETWVYQFDPEAEAQSSVWLFPGDTPPLKFKQSRSTSKQMVALYIAKTGHITTIPLEERRTVTADWYVHQCLPQVLHAVCTRRPKSSITLHHDNAPAHTAAATREFPASEDVLQGVPSQRGCPPPPPPPPPPPTPEFVSSSVCWKCSSSRFGS